LLQISDDRSTGSLDDSSLIIGWDDNTKLHMMCWTGTSKIYYR
jgi:hypothetical protein